ncbi:uncharacterized protein LOC123245811 [Gracilinanus agilis]|uniref:uncharacterized protein LOC123245811 n=1 Tax=Gracilinanus agilis TaxID=191870 RepID=UPI001CFD9B90|nr:uncharacterized protein LOC123245811 [Gracilinanus agilis]
MELIEQWSGAVSCTLWQGEWRMAGEGPGQLKEDQIKSVMTKKTSSGQLLLESSEQTSFQKDHLTYKCLWKKEEFVVLKNGRELESEMRTSTYKNKKLLFQNIILKLPLPQGKQANNGVRKAVLAQRCLGSKKVSSALTKTRVLALARKGESIKKQNNPRTELQKELENAQNQKIGVSTEIPLQFATADLDLLARRWWWLKRAFLKASPNVFASRNNQENQGNRENNPKPLKKYALSSLEATKTVQQSIRIWKLYNLNVVSKEPCKSVNSKRALGVDDEEPEKDEIMLKVLCGRLLSLNISANVVSQRKLTAFIKTLMARLPGKSQPAFAKLSGMLTVLKAAISPKSSFHLESQEANSMFPSVLVEDLRLRSKKSIEPDKHNVTVTNHYRKLLHANDHLPSDLLSFPGFAPSSELNKRQKRDAKGETEMVAVPVGEPPILHVQYELTSWEC